MPLLLVLLLRLTQVKLRLGKHLAFDFDMDLRLGGSETTGADSETVYGTDGSATKESTG